MTTVLSFDTSTTFASVALVSGSDEAAEVLAEGQSGENNHSERLLVVIDDVLRTAGIPLARIHGVAVGAGPGSFTGLRIGMATAKGLAFALNKPLWAVSSLAALALDITRVPGIKDDLDRALIVPILDARRGEVYAGFYRTSGPGVVGLSKERVLPPVQLADCIRTVRAETQLERVYVLGNGLEAYAGQLEESLYGLAHAPEGALRRPSAASVGRLALIEQPEDALTTGAPTYIRLSDAEIKFPHGNPGGPFAAPK